MSFFPFGTVSVLGIVKFMRCAHANSNPVPMYYRLEGLSLLCLFIFTPVFISKLEGLLELLATGPMAGFLTSDHK
jgi:hypothetical protein